jgi:hypothetical protein
MTRTKTIYSILLAAILLATQIIAVGAAPAKQDTTPITGIVKSITMETDATSEVTTVVVTLADETGAPLQTVRLSFAYASSLNLVIDEETYNPDAIGTSPLIDPTMVIPDVPEETTTEEAQHPVGSALSDFFSELLGVDYQTIMDYHDDGIGFGVIAQALWMTNALEGDADTFAAILEAKQNKDYSAITLPDGSTPQNWGQFRKAVMSDRDKSKENLGAIMSGRADNGQSDPTQVNTQNNGNGPDKDKSNNGNGPDKDKSNNGNGPDKDKGNNGNGNGNNKDKNKDKGNNK